LTARDAEAPDFLHALSLPGPTNSGPESLQIPAPDSTNESVMAAHEQPPNQLQQALAEMASHLPAGTANVASHITALKSGALKPEVPGFDSVRDALEHASAGLARFLASPKATLSGG
jgi:hypothetical protein